MLYAPTISPIAKTAISKPATSQIVFNGKSSLQFVRRQHAAPSRDVSEFPRNIQFRIRLVCRTSNPSQNNVHFYIADGIDASVQFRTCETAFGKRESLSMAARD